MENTIIAILFVFVFFVGLWTGWGAKRDQMRKRSVMITCSGCGKQRDYRVVKYENWKVDATETFGFCQSCWEKEERRMIIERMLSYWDGVKISHDFNSLYTIVEIPDSTLMKLGINKQEN